MRIFLRHSALPSILVVSTLALSQMGGCATTDTTAATFLDSPATQAEVQTLTAIGTTALNTWLSAQVTKGRHQSKDQFIADQTDRAAKQHPQIPRAKISAAIREKLADK